MRLLLFAVLVVATGAAARAEDVVVVLGSDQRPYQTALDALQRELGRPAPVLRSSRGAPEIPADAKVVVALGGRAALQRYPDSVALVYGLAPGVTVRRAGATAKVEMSPRPQKVIESIRKLDPACRSLAVMWQSPAAEDLVRELRGAGEKAGMSVRNARVASADDLPERLRALAGSTDAIWLVADPLLLTPRSLETIRGFSVSNGVPVFAPSAGMLQYGAAASISAGFDDIGRALGRAAKAAAEGRPVEGEVYPEGVSVSVNEKAAAEAGLKTSP